MTASSASQLRVSDRQLRYGGQGAISASAWCRLTRSVYSFGETGGEGPIQPDELARAIDGLRRNRILYHVLKSEHFDAKSTSSVAVLTSALQAGDTYVQKLRTGLSRLVDAFGSDFLTFKTLYHYFRITNDIDVLVPDLDDARCRLERSGWKTIASSDDSADLEIEDSLTVGLHARVGWETPPIFEDRLLWSDTRSRSIGGVEVRIPSPEVDILTILAHIPFEKLYLDWGEMTYLYQTALEANLEVVSHQATSHGWGRSFHKAVLVLNSFHRAVFGSPSPFERIWPRWRNTEKWELPYEWTFVDAAMGLVEIGAWRKAARACSRRGAILPFFAWRAERR